MVHYYYFFLSYTLHQTLGVSQPGLGESPAFLNVDRTGDVWVQVGDTSWLLDLHDDVSMVTNFENALRLEVVTPEGAGVVEVALRAKCCHTPLLVFFFFTRNSPCTFSAIFVRSRTHAV